MVRSPAPLGVGEGGGPTAQDAFILVGFALPGLSCAQAVAGVAGRVADRRGLACAVRRAGRRPRRHQRHEIEPGRILIYQ